MAPKVERIDNQGLFCEEHAGKGRNGCFFSENKAPARGTKGEACELKAKRSILLLFPLE
jgi:hypothetical protein